MSIKCQQKFKKSFKIGGITRITIPYLLFLNDKNTRYGLHYYRGIKYNELRCVIRGLLLF